MPRVSIHRVVIRVMRTQRVKPLPGADKGEGAPGGDPRTMFDSQVPPEAGKGANTLWGTFPSYRQKRDSHVSLS